jgi:HK97 family phage major capsid protein
VYSLPAAYAGRARILCNRAFIRKIRTLYKPDSATAFTNYLWSPGLQPGAPATILDVPYELSDRMDDCLSVADAWEAAGVPAIIGAWEYYWVLPAMTFSLQRLNELYAESNQVGFIGRGEWDGMCVLTEAFMSLTIHS